MRTIETELRTAVNKSGRSILGICKATGLQYQSVYAFVKHDRTILLKSAAKLATLLDLELVPRQRKGKP